MERSSYAAAGVDIDAGNQAVKMMKDAVQSTYNQRVIKGIGSFGGLFAADGLGTDPVLVASTDGVGTKVALAALLGRCRGIGMDIVNHCINDILVQGARPLFFLDYFATAKLEPTVVVEIVSGMAEACKAADCVLLGGETAEMPGVYCENAFDVAGTIVGVVERKALLPREDSMQPEDLLLGFASSGPHTNGYSLIRKLCAGEDFSTYRADLKNTLGDTLLAPHRSYLTLLQPVLGKVKGLAHITGGGFIENIPRVLPENLQAEILAGSWPVPALFTWLQKKGDLDVGEMYRVFNMGIGLVAVISPADLDMVRSQVGEPTWVIGKLTTGKRKVVLR